MHFNLATIRDLVAGLVPLILSLTVHEYAHAWSAYKLGDSTAKSMGRLTLNPIAHIDPVGTLLLPIISILYGGMFFFGWAKPVPVSPHLFRRGVSMRGGMIITALAGPVSNLILAFFASGILVFVFLRHGEGGTAAPVLVTLLTAMLQLNIALAVFNMIPVYPLDGSRLMPTAWQAAMAKHAMLWMFGLLFLLNVEVFRWVIAKVATGLGTLLIGFWSSIL